MSNIGFSTDYIETRIDLIRHGEPQGGQKFRGSQDDPLSDLGWQQMHSAVGEQGDWDLIISSPLLRCRQFGETLASRLDTPFRIAQNLREIEFGEWEGLTTGEVLDNYPGVLEQFWKDPLSCTPPGGEPLPNFVSRVTSCWQDIIEEHKGQKVLLVCHGGTIRAILNHVLEMPLKALWRIDVPYANVSRIRSECFGNQAEERHNVVFHQEKFI